MTHFSLCYAYEMKSDYSFIIPWRSEVQHATAGLRCPPTALSNTQQQLLHVTTTHWPHSADNPCIVYVFIEVCTKFRLLFLHLLIFFHSSVSTVHLLSIVYINTSQDTEIAKNIAENWQGDFKNYLFILVGVWMIHLATAGWVWFSEIQNLIKYSWVNLPVSFLQIT